VASLPAATAPPTPTLIGIVLTASGSKVQGKQLVNLSWTGTDAADIDIYRDGVKVASVPNTSAYTDFIGVRRGNVQYRCTVCEAATDNCSN
jgi:hypothetical protein